MTINHQTTADDTSPIFADGNKGLMPHHQKELMVGSGLTLETIKSAGIYSEWMPDKLARLLKIEEKTAKRKVPCMVFPFTRADGSNGYARIKPDSPRIDRDGKKVKYESPRNEPNEIYLPPGVAQYLSDPSQELLLSEGEKKSAKASQEGFPCIGLVGVFGWKVAKQERLLPELAKVVWSGRRVYIAFDSDIDEKEGVQDGESRLAAALKAQGAIVRCLRLPHGVDADGNSTKQGLDDLLVAAGADGKRQLRKLIDDAIEPLPVNPDAIKQLAKNLDPADEAKRFLASGEKDGVHILRFHRGEFVFWNAGRYVGVQVAEVRGRVIQHLNQNFHHLTSNVTSNVIDQLKALSMLSFGCDPPAWLIRPDGCEQWEPVDLLSTKNSIIHLPSLVAGLKADIPASPRLFTPAATDFAYDAEAASPLWLAFLGEIWGDDQQSIETLQEFFGYLLTADTTLQKMLLMVGPRRSGKGTIARILRAVVGESNCCGPTLSGLGTNFGLAPLIGKTVAIVSDARLSGRTDSAMVTERLLSISGEDALTIDRKHIEQVTMKLLTRFVILTNELPRLGDSSGALSGRMVILRMTESFYGKENKKLTQQLLGERAGILNWSIKGWERLRDRGYFIQPDSGNQLREQMDDLSSPVGAFIKDRCGIGPTFEVRAKDLYAAYQAWSLSNGSKPVSDGMFGRDLFAALSTIRSVRRRDGGARVHCYSGLKLLPVGSDDDDNGDF